MGKKFDTIDGEGSGARKRKIRVRKEDSAFVYCVFESLEGVVSYSTLEHRPGDPHRDLELQVPTGSEAELERVLGELGDLVYDLDT